MNKLHRLMRFSRTDLQLLLGTFMILGAIRFGLWLLPFRILLRLVERSSQTHVNRQPAHQRSISQIVWAVEVSSRYTPGGAKCLARALTTKILLNRQGYQPDLRIGVAKSSKGVLEAHAWIEYQGRIVIGNLRDLSRYIPLPSIEEAKL